VFLVRYELGSYNPENNSLHRQCREDFKSYGNYKLRGPLDGTVFHDQRVRFMFGNLCFVGTAQQSAAPLPICSCLQLVSSVLRHDALYFCVTPVRNAMLLESFGENFALTEFPVDKYFPFWRINN
jgi:hypothetical protein